jgi:ATP-dependent protease ClpP protease subunit
MFRAIGIISGLIFGSPAVAQNLVVHGTTISISGEIDETLYDSFAYLGAALKSIDTIELNSPGGNFEYAVLLSQKIQQLNVTTVVRSGASCASACVYLYSAGKKRIASRNSWFGVHGVRIGGDLAWRIITNCSSQDNSLHEQTFSRACHKMLDATKVWAQDATEKQFELLEANGVSPMLARTFYALQDDPNWIDNLNVMKKPDWVISAADAVHYGIVTDLLEEKPSSLIQQVNN